jgi:hypothetical protein
LRSNAGRTEPTRKSVRRRGSWVFLALLTLGVQWAACTRLPTGPDPHLVIQPGLVDIAMDWSHDGRSVLFIRPYASNYGPPGVYLINVNGGQPRLITANAVNQLGFLHLSPDGSRIVGTRQFNLVIIDAATGSEYQPISFFGYVFWPVWCPDGRTVLYHRAAENLYYNPPPDSSALHALDLAAGTDRPVRIAGQLVIGQDYWFGPDGRCVFVQLVETAPLTYNANRIAVLDLRDSSIVPLYGGHDWRQYENPQWCRSGPAPGALSIIFTNNSWPGAGTWLVDAQGGNPRLFEHRLFWDALTSPEGRRMVLEGEDPITRFGILDIEDINDFSGGTRRHLTTYAPP